MTIAELNRKISSYQRTKKLEAQERAAYNYMLANLVGCSIASYFSKEVNMPKLEEAYPSLFTDAAEDTKQKKAKQKAELSALRFRQFADSYNQRLKK